MSTFKISAQTLRTFLAAVGIAAALHLAQAQDALTDFTRPLVIGILNGLGILAKDEGAMMTIGHLEIPWTRDCAGINLLLILLAITVWVNRNEKSWTRFLLRTALAVPAALAANVARVLTLIAYRAAFYPGVESPQSHYFMGLVWLVPFVSLVLPKNGRPLSLSWLETLHAAAVVALLAPLAGTPNGSLMVICAVIALARCRVRLDKGWFRVLLTILWMVAGLGIAMINMESFWLPWLLLCPPLLDLRWVRQFSGICIMLSTHSMIAMQSWAIGLAGAGIVLTVLPFVKKRPSEPDEPAVSSSATPWLKALRYACLISFVCPFTASSLLALGFQKWAPPVSVSARSIGNDGYEIRLADQPSQLGLVCYAAPSRDRHHTIQVCLKYRGVELTNVATDPAIYSDGSHWLREFFLQDGVLHSDYADYLRSTFHPWADPGVHLIFVAPQNQMTSADFDRQCQRFAAEFESMCRPQPLPTQALAAQP